MNHCALTWPQVTMSSSPRVELLKMPFELLNGFWGKNPNLQLFLERLEMITLANFWRKKLLVMVLKVPMLWTRKLRRESVRSCWLTAEPIGPWFPFTEPLRNFHRHHINQRWSFVDQSKVIYSAGFTVAANYEAVMELATHAATSDPHKVFAFNLSAPYVCRTHCARLLTLLPLVDILFGNENEATALAEALDWKVSLSHICFLIYWFENQEKNLSGIAVKLAKMSSKKVRRIVIITQGPDPVLVAENDGNEVHLKTFEVPKVDEEEKVDTNGAGDAFVGGFLGTLVSRLSLDIDGRIMMQSDLVEESIKSGVECATKMIKVIGCDLIAFKWSRN